MTSRMYSILLMCCISVTLAVRNDSSNTVEQIAEGLEIAKDTLEIVNGLLKISEVAFPILEPITGILGAFFGIFSLIFSSGTESPEMIYMREQFGQINMKLDTIAQDLTQIKDIIAEDTLKAAYVTDEGKILFGYEQLKAFLGEIHNLTCNNGTQCQRERIRVASRYIKYFEVNRNMQNIYRGSMDNTTVFSKPLIDHIKISSGCSVPKIQKFSDGILKLAMKEQKVTMIHEMLQGTSYSITNRMNIWLKRMYTLKDHTKMVIDDCFSHINKYMLDDIRNPKYQSDFSTNSAAANALKKHLEDKYPWLNWIVLAYDHDDDTEEYSLNNAVEGFWTTGNKRDMIAVFFDKGTYTTEKRDDVFNAIDYIIRKGIGNIIYNTYSYHPYRKMINVVHAGFVRELKARGVWPSIQSFTLLRDDSHFYSAKDATQVDSFFERSIRSYDYRLVIVFKSLEEQKSPTCNIACEHGGKCIRYPYASTFSCECKHLFYGPHCEFHSNTTIALNLEAVVQQMMKIPKLSDIFFQIKDASNLIGSSIGHIQRAINHLDKSIGKAFVQLHEDLSKQFRWIGILNAYGEQIKSLQYFIQLFEEYKLTASQNFRNEHRALAEAVLGSQRYNGIRRWLHDFNNLINGTTGFTLTPEEPLLITYMEQFKDKACINEYKNAIDNVWRQLMLLQQRGYIVWLQALHILNEPSDFALKQYEDYTNSQIDTLSKKTCSLIIPFSDQVNCSGGYYLNERILVKVTCKANYFLKGNDTVACSNGNAACAFCNCSLEGSTNQQCEAQTGKCKCKSKFYGDKCENRDCVWSNWGLWAACNKTCDHGMKTRKRQHAVSRKGSGIECTGDAEKSAPCFHACCSSQFTCPNNKCISKVHVCDNVNDCGDWKDESDCCVTKYTTINDWGGGDSVYLDRHRLDCGPKWMLKEFKLERPSHNGIQYRYVCCRFSESFCTTHMVNNQPTQSDDEMVYLDRQYVNCGSKGILNMFQLVRTDSHHWRYTYNCCNVNKSFSSTCKDRASAYTYDGDGDNVYLDRQHVRCDRREFLSYFHLERNNNHDNIRYRYKCCTVRRNPS